MKTSQFDVAVIGAGAAGMMCAARAAQQGLRVVLIDHAKRLGEKIRISGGGRCNFTNIAAGPDNYLSDNPKYCRFALQYYTAQDFIALVNKHKIAWHEKHKGQLFCDESSEQIIAMLKKECDQGKVTWLNPFTVESIEQKTDGLFSLVVHGAQALSLEVKNVVIATGGLPVAQIGASDFGLKIARQFGLKVIEPRPALVPLEFKQADWQQYSQLAGLSSEVEISTEDKKTQFQEDLLFTHKGLSGPAILQISSFWKPNEGVYINLLPQISLIDHLLVSKNSSKQQLKTVLADLLPKRLAQQCLSVHGEIAERKIAEIGDKQLRLIAEQIQQWFIKPEKTAGYKKAEVMSGGVDTKGLNPNTMQSRKIEGLYFIGEVVDVTGWLGGYNFQWAWSSAVVCADHLLKKLRNS